MIVEILDLCWVCTVFSFQKQMNEMKGVFFGNIKKKSVSGIATLVRESFSVSVRPG